MLARYEVCSLSRTCNLNFGVDKVFFLRPIEDLNDVSDSLQKTFEPVEFGPCLRFNMITYTL
jgi:hypothetical protein